MPVAFMFYMLVTFNTMACEGSASSLSHRNEKFFWRGSSGKRKNVCL